MRTDAVLKKILKSWISQEWKLFQFYDVKIFELQDEEKKTFSLVDFRKFLLSSVQFVYAHKNPKQIECKKIELNYSIKKYN